MTAADLNAYVSQFIAELHLATLFLTRISLPAIRGEIPSISRAVSLAPLIGIALAALSILVEFIMSFTTTPRIQISFIVLVLYVILGWSLHLDGWCDIWDAWGSGKSGDDFRKILKDSRIGVFGAIGLFVALGFYLTTLSSVANPYSYIFIAVPPVIGRLNIVALARIGDYPWESGLGSSVVRDTDDFCLLRAGVPAFIWCAIWGVGAIVALIASLSIVPLILRFCNARMGGVNGDALGFSEVGGELVSLLTLSMIGRW